MFRLLICFKHHPHGTNTTVAASQHSFLFGYDQGSISLFLERKADQISGIVRFADGTNTLHQPGSQDLLPLPTHTSSESPSLSPQPPQPHPSSTLAAAAGAPLSAAPTSASQPLLQQKPTEEQLAAGQNPMQEQRPQLRPQLGGGALIAAAEMQGERCGTCQRAVVCTCCAACYDIAWGYQDKLQVQGAAFQSCKLCL